jgi:glyoxylase-like metal-dependent hydrolase (beta-lactamase superfamily II)
MGGVEVELQPVCPSVFTWSRYAPEVKADLWSTAVIGDRGAYLVDPIAIDAETLRNALKPAEVLGVVVTNENHERAAAEIARKFMVGVHSRADARAALNLPDGSDVSDGEHFAPGVTAIAIDGAPAGEIAIYAEPDGGTLIIGDALINMGSYGFTFLPAKYCRNQKQMRRSLRKLLDFDFERITFAHGLPIVANARSRLANLLEGA